VAGSRVDLAIVGERIARQGLTARDAASVAAVTGATVGIQAQDLGAARLGVRVRMRLITDADVRRAIEVERTVVRTWLMRATIHLVSAADVRWLSGLFGPMIARKFATRWRQLGLDPKLLDRCADAIPDILAGRTLTRSQITEALNALGIAVDPSDQAPLHVLLYTSTLGLTCRADSSGEGTFALTDEWLPAAPTGSAGPASLAGDDALAELARRYFCAYSPATAADFTTWSGLPATRAIELIRAELEPVDINGRAGFRLGTVDPERGVSLLPAFDNYLLGYRDRSLIIDQANVPDVYVGGIIKPTVLVDGRVAGIWRLERKRTSATVVTSMFWPVSAKVQRAIGDEAAAIGAFLEPPFVASWR
jgi:Winged helix DNA-binding domain